MKHILTVLLLSISISMFSQERRETIDGKEYIIHTVKKGETLYGISNQYDVSKKDLRGSNSGMLLFIKIGQEIKVPVPLSERNIHTVEKGETLYGISKKYGMTIDELVKLNPKKSSNLKEGDKLKLNSSGNKGSTKTPVVNTVKNTAVHVVKKGETLYGIARQYKITVADLQKLNQGLKESIAIGDKLNVPASKNVVAPNPKTVPNNEQKAVVKTKTIQYTVEKGETLYGIAKKYNTTVEAIQKGNPGVTSLKEGDKLNITLSEDFVKDIGITLGDPVTPNGNFNEINKINPLKDKLNEMILEKKETYSVSLFLPLMLDKNAQLTQEVGKPTKINRDTENSTHFYQGLMMALDSIAETGVSIDLQVYDTENDTAQVGKYLKASEVKNSDLIIGPFHEKPYSQVVNFAKQNKIQAVSPVLRYNNRLLFDNMYVTKLETSLPTQINYLASYLARNRNTENVICVSGSSKKDKYLADSFSADFNKAIAPFNNNYRNTVSTFSFVSYSSMKGFDAKLVKGKKNIIVIPILEEGLATSFFTQLNVMMTRSRMKGYDVEIYALENFFGFDDIETSLKHRYNLHITSPSYVDYNHPRVKNFVKEYRARFGTEPNKYAFIGFDVAIYHGAAMGTFGKNYTAYYDQVKIPLLQSNYVLKRSDTNSGFENQSVFILKYEEYNLVKVN